MQAFGTRAIATLRGAPDETRGLFFENQEAILIYIAKKLRDAIRLEKVLTDAGVDYGVETDEYRGGLIFVTNRIGAFFYVLPETAAAAREIMQSAGFKPHLEAVSGK